MGLLNVLSLLLVIVGAINWGLWGFFQFDLVAFLFKGNDTTLSRLVYSLVGLAGVWGLRFFSKCKVLCCSKPCSSEKVCEDKDSSNQGGGCCKL